MKGVNLTASEDSPQDVGTTIHLAATVEGAESETTRAEYMFRMKQGKTWFTVKPWGTANTYDWTPDETGNYIIEVQTRTQGRRTTDASTMIVGYWIISQ